jgi:hypothetical protein
MIYDPTLKTRRRWNAQVNDRARSREELEEIWGQVIDHLELRKNFNQFFFANPVLICRRKSDDQRGTLLFQFSPRFYFRWKPFEEQEVNRCL